jgi:hypothetical protein
MAKLVILTQGLNGRAHELNVDRTTIGRVEDNMFQIAEPSVSSHHCEVLLRGSDVVIKDLNSTNGTFINGEQITESVLKPGQTLRLGQIELKLETGTPAGVRASQGPRSRPGQKTGGSHHGHPARRQLERTGRRRTAAGLRHQQGIFQKAQPGRHLFLDWGRYCGDYHCGLLIIALRRSITANKAGRGHETALLPSTKPR